jgi:putative transcriptional regulator
MEVENMSKKYRSPAMAAVHEMMSDLHEAGVVDKVTMRHFDDQCLTPIQEMTPSVIVSLRKRERASQAVFARYLNIPPSLVSQWERGEKRPNGPSLKLLCLVKAKGLSAIM